MIEPTTVDFPDWLMPLVNGLRQPYEMPFLKPPAAERETLRLAAVLALFGEGPFGPDVLLLERNPHMRNHAGQPAFPGGGIDPTDDGPIAAALREAQEETGVEPDGVEVIATLPELWLPPSGNLVTPVVGWWREPSEVHAAVPAEVAAVARVPIADLTEPANRLVVTGPGGRNSPGFRVAGMLVWGFTAGILSWLLQISGWEREWDRTVTAPAPLPGGQG
jgi:8-oxo-dGTP pyrophosphatase MutT (NUDIX family)